MKQFGLTLVIGAVLAGLLYVLPSPAVAQDLKSLQLHVIPTAGGNLLPLVSNLIQKILLIIGIVAFFYLLYAGFNYVTAGGDPAKTKTSMSTIVNVVIGILIIAVSYVLLSYVIAETKKI